MARKTIVGGGLFILGVVVGILLKDISFKVEYAKAEREFQTWWQSYQEESKSRHEKMKVQLAEMEARQAQIADELPRD